MDISDFRRFVGAELCKDCSTDFEVNLVNVFVEISNSLWERYPAAMYPAHTALVSTLGIPKDFGCAHKARESEAEM